MSTDFEPSVDLSEWVSQADAARMRGVTRQAVAKLVAQGRLQTLDVAGRALVRRSDVLNYVPQPAGRPKSAHG